MRINEIGLLLLSLAAGASGCAGGTETGNPSFTATLSYTAHSSQAKVSLRAVGASVRVDSVWLDLAAVSLRADPSCGSSQLDLKEVPGLGIGDHATGMHNFTSFDGRRERYCALELPLTQAGASGAAPSDFVGNSLLLSGALADGTPFRISSRRAPTLRLLADENNFELSSDESHLLVAFDVAAWLADVDLAAAERTLGTISISEDHNPALLTAFEANLASGVELYRDAGDGKLHESAKRLAHGE